MRFAVGATMLMTGLLVAVAARPLAVGSAQTPAGRPGGAPQQAKNLQVLPKDMPMQQVQAVMRTFTAGLGVQCVYCHSGTPQDRALDDKKEKLVARKMLAMVNAINDQYLKDVGEPAAAPAGAPAGTMTPKVTCYTCHRGTTKPLTAAPPGGGLVHPALDLR